MDLWEKMLLKDLEAVYQETSDKKVTSVFFGGGTPSTMPPKIVGSLISAIHRLWFVAPDVEISLEANPTSVEQKNFKALSSAGVNRVSLGIQSLNNDHLKFLGRTHSGEEARSAIAIAQKHFKKHNFDFIYTLPTEELSSWEADLKEILDLGSRHLSLYQLTIEEGTPFFLQHARGDFMMKSPEESALFFEQTKEILTGNEFHNYEVSNFAKSSKDECLHNLAYWKSDDYVGIGPGAHGRFYRNGKRYFARRHRAPDRWLQDVGAHGNGTHEGRYISQKEKAEELFMMGLRLTDGISIQDFESKMEESIGAWLCPEAELSLVKEGLLKRTDTRIFATKKGLQKLNGVLSYIFNYPKKKMSHK